MACLSFTWARAPGLSSSARLGRRGPAPPPRPAPPPPRPPPPPPAGIAVCQPAGARSESRPSLAPLNPSECRQCAAWAGPAAPPQVHPAPRERDPLLLEPDPLGDHPAHVGPEADPPAGVDHALPGNVVGAALHRVPDGPGRPRSAPDARG